MKNNEKIIFRLAKTDDAEKLVEIYAPYVKNTNITFEYEVPTIDEFKQRITKIMSKFPYIVACIGDEIVGYTYASTFRERQAYNWCVETSIYINEKYACRYSFHHFRNCNRSDYSLWKAYTENGNGYGKSYF